jgi:hypothetical protein
MELGGHWSKTVDKGEMFYPAELLGLDSKQSICIPCKVLQMHIGAE